MSIFKQIEDAELTLEEVQELIELLDGVLPRVKRKVDEKRRSSILAKNLRDSLAKEGSIAIPDEMADDKHNLEKGYKLLESANLKLINFRKSIVD